MLKKLLSLKFFIFVTTIAAGTIILLIVLFEVNVERNIREIISKNPEIILDALESLQLREQERLRESQLSVLTELGQSIRFDPNVPVGGNANGDVTIVEFYDYKCHYCKQFNPHLDEILNTDPNIRLVYRELPILGPDSTIAARLSLAVAELYPNQFEIFHSALMSTRGTLDEQTVLQVAREIGFDADLLQIEMVNPRIDRAIQNNRKIAQALGINGTPGFLIGDVIIPGYIDANEVLRLVALARESCKTC